MQIHPVVKKQTSYFTAPDPRKLIGFDIEIVKEVGDAADWKAQRPLGIACMAVAYSSGDVLTLYPGYGDAKMPGQVGGAMSAVELQRFVYHLAGAVESGYTVVTWNRLSFDFDILAEESGCLDECARLALGHIDLMFQFLCIRGHYLSLEAALRGCGLTGKLDGLTGADAPVLWKQGSAERQKVLHYVANDAAETLKLAQFISKKGYLGWTSRSGKQNKCNFFELLTCEQAMYLPFPDTSWMDKPVVRADAYAWVPEGILKEYWKGKAEKWTKDG